MSEIELTQYSLIRFGFVKINESLFRKNSGDICIRPFDICLDYENNVFKIAFQGYWYTIKYENQLKSLYLALNNEELTYEATQ